MKENNWHRSGEYKCWSCKEWVSNIELSNADGFCIHCDQQIDIYDEPYTEISNNERPSNMDKNKQREEFESYWVDSDFSMCSKQEAFVIWQAAQKSVLLAIKSELDEESARVHAEVIADIKAAGLRVKS